MNSRLFTLHDKLGFKELSYCSAGFLSQRVSKVKVNIREEFEIMQITALLATTFVYKGYKP